MGFIDPGALGNALLNAELTAGALAPGSATAPIPTPTQDQQGVQEAWSVFSWYWNYTAAFQHDTISAVIGGIGGVG